MVTKSEVQECYEDTDILQCSSKPDRCYEQELEKRFNYCNHPCNLTDYTLVASTCEMLYILIP